MQGIAPDPPTIRAVGIAQRHIQLRPEHLEINRASIGLKLIAEIAQPLQSFIDIEKSWLASHPDSPSLSTEENQKCFAMAR
jgi:hypothetical protein